MTTMTESEMRKNFSEVSLKDNNYFQTLQFSQDREGEMENNQLERIRYRIREGERAGYSNVLYTVTQGNGLATFFFFFTK